MSANKQESGITYPGSTYAWSMVVFLTLAYFMSFADRYVLGLLVEPIKEDLGFTDNQIGLLMGAAFGIVYATMGIPIGWLADRTRRTAIVAAGIAVWSLATAATGLASKFYQIFVARMFVGIGEASLSPCAMSMISDSFPPEKRAKPIAFYTMALPLGAGIATLFTGGVLIWAKSVPPIHLTADIVLAPWQLIFMAVGLPGLILSLVFLFLREPKRTGRGDQTEARGASPLEMARYVLGRYKAYAGIVVMVASMMIVAYSQGWLAATFERTWGWPAEKYAIVNGLILLIVGPATILSAGWLSDRLFSRGRHDAPYLILLTGVAVLVPTGIAATLMPSPELAMGLLAINTIGIALASAVGPTAILAITPERIRAQTVAGYYMIAGLAGLMLGPYTVGKLSDHVFGNEEIRYAVAAVPLIFGIPALLIGIFSRKAYVKELNARLAAG